MHPPGPGNAEALQEFVAVQFEKRLKVEFTSVLRKKPPRLLCSSLNVSKFPGTRTVDLGTLPTALSGKPPLLALRLSDCGALSTRQKRFFAHDG